MNVLSRAAKIIVQPYRGIDLGTWRLLSGGFANAMNTTVIIYLSLYLNVLGYSIRDIGLVASSFGLAGILGAYWGGILTNKLGAMRVCRGSLLASFASLVLLAKIPSLGWAIALASALGIFASGFRSSYILVLSDDKGEGFDLDRVVALRRIAINFGMAAGAAIGGALASIDFRLVFAFNAAAALIAYAALYSKCRRGHAPVEPKEVTPKVHPSPDAVMTSSWPLYLNIGLLFLVLLVFNQSHGVYALYLKSMHGLETKAISTFFIINGIIIGLTQLPLSSYLKRYAPNSVCAGGAFLICAGFAILPWCSSYPALMASCIMWTIGEIILFPAQLASILRMAGKNQARPIAIYQSAFSLASFAAPALGSFLYAQKIDAIWHIAAILAVVVAICYQNLERLTLRPLLRNK